MADWQSRDTKLDGLIYIGFDEKVKTNDATNLLMGQLKTPYWRPTKGTKKLATCRHQPRRPSEMGPHAGAVHL